MYPCWILPFLDHAFLSLYFCWYNELPCSSNTQMQKLSLYLLCQRLKTFILKARGRRKANTICVKTIISGGLWVASNLSIQRIAQQKQNECRPTIKIQAYQCLSFSMVLCAFSYVFVLSKVTMRIYLGIYKPIAAQE